MRHLPYPDRTTAAARSALWAAYLGCCRNPGDVTTHLYAVRERVGDAERDEGLPEGVQCALEVPVTDRRTLVRLVRADQLTDEEIARVLDLFDPWAPGTAYVVGALCVDDGRLWQCLAAHTSAAGDEPSKMPARWRRRPTPRQ